ncbi:MAG: hypothetical protein HKN49_04950, partial [Gammaproteobacteria bacterium]|nr:hypothetical protein [Gammaproteobacteria bacterium]
IVTARSGDSLTVRGARIEYSDGVEVFRGSGTVLLGSTTTVTAPGVNNADLSIDSISVGQRIVAFGELSDDRTLDATDGRVAMRMNQMTARVVTAEPLAVDWYFLNGRRPAVFDFSGTGAAPDLDADPDHYEIDTGAMSLDTLQTDDFVRVRGLVNDFGAAPADFNARTVIDIATEQRPGTLYVGWAGGSAMPFHSLTADQIDIDLSAARELLKLRGVPLDISNPLESAILLPTESGSGIYAVKVRGSGELHIYREFAAMVDELDRQLDSGAVMHRITAHVRYNPDTDGFVTPRASFVLAMPQP